MWKAQPIFSPRAHDRASPPRSPAPLADYPWDRALGYRGRHTDISVDLRWESSFVFLRDITAAARRRLLSANIWEKGARRPPRAELLAAIEALEAEAGELPADVVEPTPTPEPAVEPTPSPTRGKGGRFAKRTRS